MSDDTVTKETTEGQQGGTSSEESQAQQTQTGADKTAEGATQAEGAKTEEAQDQTTETVKSLLAEGEDGSAKDAAKSAEAPEQYEEFKLPEGFQKNGPLIEEFTPLAREAKLPQEMAQKFVDLGAKLVADTQAAQQKAWEGVVSQWTADLKADKEVGGAALKENTGYAIRALKQFADPETRKYLDDTRLANHPGIFKMLVRAGKALGEDKLLEGGASRAEQSAAKILYPNMK